MTDLTKCYRCGKPSNIIKKGHPYCWDCLLRDTSVGEESKLTYSTVSNWGVSTKGKEGTHSDYKVPSDKLKPEREGRREIPEDCPSCHADWNIQPGWKLQHLVVVTCKNPWCKYEFDTRKPSLDPQRWRR